jgi:hypothetical protein
MRTKFTLFAIFIAIFLSGPAQQPPNGSFENWTNVYTPTGWAGLEVAFSSLHTFLTPTWTFKDTTTSTQGIASLKLVTDSPPGYTQILGGIISVGSATFANNKPIFSGIPFNYRPDTLIFDYQYSSPGTDTAASIVILTDSSGNNLLGPLGSHGVTVTLHNSSTWVHVAYVLTSYYQSPATPDSLMLGFTSSNNSPVVGSTLLVDNVRFGYYTGARISATIMASGLNVCPGDSVKLTANTGTNYTYQWNLGAQPIAGATSSTYYAKTGGSYTVTIDSASANATSLPVVITANCGSGSITATINPSGLNVCNGDSVLLAANNGVNYTFQWYRNGNGIIGATSVNYYAKTAGSYTVTIDSATASGTSTAVIITSNCGFTATIHSLGTNICNGDSVLLSANTGNNYTYHWKLNGTAIPGATFSTYYAKTAGSYTVTIDSALSIATSQPVVITANCGSGSLTATINPSGLNVCNGDSVLLAANNGVNYTFQWYRNGNGIIGATSVNYYAKTAGSYTVTIDSATASGTSTAVIITSNCGFTATIHSLGTNICNGDSVLLSANTGNNYTYHWKLNGTAIPGATFSTYYAKTAGSYTVTIDSALSIATSQPVVITANCGSGSITATINPSGLNVCNGDSVLLTANSGANYTWQWYQGVASVTGATSNTYYAKTAGSYTVKIDSASSTATSQPVVITANCGTDTLTATIIPSGTNVCNGDSVLLRANGGINYTYQWYLGLAPVTGATSSTYYAKTAGGYTVVIDSASFSTTSLPVAITANCGSGTITAIISAPNTNICNGDSVLLTANTGTGYTYQWNLDGTAINAATAVTYYAKTTGSYTVTIDSASAIGTSPFVAITDTGCVNGINNIAADNFSIYPNPASTLLNINSSENLAGSDLQVYDLVGRLVISQVLTGTNNAVDVAKLANGTYIFRITDKENNALTQSKFNVIK